MAAADIIKGSVNTDLRLRSAVGSITPDVVADNLDNIIDFVTAAVLPATSSEVQASLNIAIWGDSLGLGTGGSETSMYPSGVPFAQYLMEATGWNVQTFSVGGQSSTLIKNRFLAATDKRSWGTIFEMGTNNAGAWATVKADVLACITALGHSRYLVCGVPLAQDPGHWAGTPGGDFVAAANAEMLALVGAAHFVDVRAKLVSIFDPALSQDVLDFGHNIPPTSAMALGDVIHNNDKGYKFGWAAAILEKWSVLTTFSADEEKILSNENALQLFKQASPISTPSLFSKRAAFNYAMSTLLSWQALNGSGRIDGAAVEIGGNLVLWNEGAAVGKEGGIAIRNSYYDEGGRANMVLMGTNSAVWTSVVKGMRFLNNIATVIFGSKVQIEDTLKLSGAGNMAIGDLALFDSAGNIRAVSIGMGSVFSANRRPIDFGTDNKGGLLLPFMTTAEAAVQDAHANVAVRTRWSEMAYNTTTNRPMVAGYIGGFGVWKPLAYQSDIVAPDGSETKFTTPLSDIIIAGAGTVASPYALSLASTGVPGGLNLIGTMFGTAGTIPGTNDVNKTIDGSFSTGWVANQANAGNHIGISFTVPYVIKSIYIYPETGSNALLGTLFQGSNESTSAGWVTLYTFAVNPPNSVYTLYDVGNSLGFKHYRIIKPGVGNMSVREFNMLGFLAKPVDYGFYTPTGLLDTKGAPGDKAYDENFYYFKTPIGWKKAAAVTATDVKIVPDADYVVLPTDLTVIFSALTANRAITYPSAAAFPGRLLNVRNGRANFTVTSVSNLKIDAAFSFSNLIKDQGITIQSDGADWWLVNNFYYNNF